MQLLNMACTQPEQYQNWEGVINSKHTKTLLIYSILKMFFVKEMHFLTSSVFYKCNTKEEQTKICLYG